MTTYTIDFHPERRTDAPIFTRELRVKAQIKRIRETVERMESYGTEYYKLGGPMQDDIEFLSHVGYGLRVLLGEVSR